MTPLLTILLAASNAVTITQPGANTDKKLAAQQLFQEVVSARDSLPLETCIQKLEKVTRLDGKFAEAFHELGRAYMERGTIDGRNRAERALARAIRLAPDNTDYHYTLAQLHLKREMQGAAAGEFHKIMKIDPADARPYYHLALFKEEDMLHHRDMISPHEDAIIYFYDFAGKDFAEAERLLRTAIALDSKMIEAYYRLAALYFEARHYDEMAALLEQGISQQSAPDLFLFLGLARQQLGDTEAAMAAYERALQMMSPEDRRFFYALQSVLVPDSLKAYESADDSLKARMQRRFWKMRDPLFLTAANERLLEHFGRVAYANLRYSFPEKKIEGWKTDRGQTLIRFGHPRWRVRTRADLGTTETGRMTLNPSREFWDYGDFRMIFDDRFLNRNYSFAWGSVGEVDGKWLFEQKIREVPELYTFPHGGRRLDLPHVIAQFRSAADLSDTANDSTLLEIYFGVPDTSLHASASRLGERQGRRFELRRGLFFFDENWNEAFAWREDRNLFQPAPASDFAAASKRLNKNEKSVGRRGLRRAQSSRSRAVSVNFLIDRWTVRMAPGSYHLSLEVMDRQSGHSGTKRENIIVEGFPDDRLSMSSVILANQLSNVVSAENPTESNSSLVLYNKGDVNLVPSLLRQFSPSTPIYVYYEVYNLTLNENGQSRYRIDNILAPALESKSLVASTVGRIGQWLGLGERPASITTSFESTGNGRTEKLYHSLELLGRQNGAQQLTIQINDLISGQTTSRQVHFEIVGER